MPVDTGLRQLHPAAMHRPGALGAPFTAATLVVLATGCATVERAPAAAVRPMDARMVPVVQLLGAKAVPDAVRVIGGPDGSAHVFVVSRRLRRVLPVSVAPDDDLKHAPVRSEVAPWKVDAAFDSQGRLQLLLDTDKPVLQNSEWKASDRTPWHAAGVTVASARFVAGALQDPGLTTEPPSSHVCVVSTPPRRICQGQDALAFTLQGNAFQIYAD